MAFNISCVIIVDSQTLTSIGGGRGQWLGGHHGECGARAYNGGLGAEPLAGSRGRAPGQAESILVIGCPTEPANLAPFQKCPFELRYTQQTLNRKRYALLRSTGVRVGGPECMVPPTPSLGGLCPPVPRLRRLCWYRLTRVVLVKGPLNGNSYCNTFPVGLLRYCRTYKNSTFLQVLFVLLQYLLLRSV